MPKTYRQNAFRVLALPIDVTMRDIKRRQVRLEACRKLGTKPSNGEHIYLPLDPPPDEDDISRSIQRLQDPQARLLDEFFWFWPQEISSSNDPGLKLLKSNRRNEAMHLWEKSATAGKDVGISIHNLAVLFHATALDMEYKARKQKLSERENQAIQMCWKQAFINWRKLLEDEGFWSRVTAKIREAKDPRLTTGTAHRRRQSLPEELLMVNARLALEAAEKGRSQDAQKHITIMQKSQFEQSLVYEVLRKVVHDIRQRIKMRCVELSAKADKDHSKADNVATELLKETAPLLSVIDLLLPKEDVARVNAHDEVATAAMQCQILHGNKTADWKTSLDILQEALRLVGSESVLSRIRKNIEIVTINMKVNLCFFCERNQADNDSVIEVGMHGEVQKIPTGYNSYRITWRHGKIKVPRCAECKRNHERTTNWTAGIGSLGGIIGGIVGLAISAATDNFFFLFLFAAIGATAGGIFGHHRAHSQAAGEYKPLSKQNEYSVIKDRLSEGWAFGEEPPQNN